MAGASVSLTIHEIDVDAPLAVLQALEAEATDLTAVMDRIGGALVASVERRFETGTGPDGQPWVPSRRAREQSGQTLVNTGRLRDSITHEADAGGVEVGTNVVYAGIHQFGGTINRAARTQTIYRRYNKGRNELSNRFVSRRRSNFASDHDVAAHDIVMPARPYLGLDDEDEAEVTAIISDALREAGLAAGAGR